MKKNKLETQKVTLINMLNNIKSLLIKNMYTDWTMIHIDSNIPFLIQQESHLLFNLFWSREGCYKIKSIVSIFIPILGNLFFPSNL